MALCRDRQVSGLLEQPPKLRLWSKAHGRYVSRKGSYMGAAPISELVSRWVDRTPLSRHRQNSSAQGFRDMP